MTEKSNCTVTLTIIMVMSKDDILVTLVIAMYCLTKFTTCNIIINFIITTNIIKTYHAAHIDQIKVSLSIELDSIIKLAVLNSLGHLALLIGSNEFKSFTLNETLHILCRNLI